MASGGFHVLGIPILLFLFAALIVIGLLLLRRYVRGPMYKGKGRMDGKVVVITGANTGIGKITALDMAQRGAKVIILCRDVSKAKTVVEEIKSEIACDISYMKCDLASLGSVRTCANELKQKAPKIHVLINNAGIMMCPQWETEDGFEMQFGTNHLGHFLLTNLLLDNIKAAAPSRIINVSSLAHTLPGAKMHWDDLNMKRNYNSVTAYSQSKLANILFTRSLAKMLKDDCVTTYSLHPGSIKTDLQRHLADSYGAFFSVLSYLMEPFFKTPLLGAQTTIYCAVDESAGKETGLYYSDCKKKTPSRDALNEEYADRLWKISLEMVGLKDSSEAKDS